MGASVFSRPGESAQFLGSGTCEQRYDDVGMQWPALGGGQERGGLIVSERLGRAALLSLRDVAEQHDVAFYLVPGLRAGDGPPEDRMKNVDGRIMTGFASMGQTREESQKAMAGLIESEGVAYVHD